MSILWGFDFLTNINKTVYHETFFLYFYIHASFRVECTEYVRNCSVDAE